MSLSVQESVHPDDRGALTLECVEGEGTIVRLFPPVDERGLSPSAPDPFEETADIRQARRGMIVIAEDEMIVREGLVAMLEGLGFETFEVGTQAELLERLDEIPAPRLVLLDWTMPGNVDGETAVAALRERRPGLPIVVMSGCGGDQLESDLRRIADGFLSKPFRRRDLIRILDQVLGETGGSGAGP